MSQKLVFDTLQYATLLNDGGISNANVYATSLAAVLGQNIYLKDEVNQMNDALLKRIDATLAKAGEDRLSFERKVDATRMELEMHFDRKLMKMQNRSDKAINRSIIMSVSLIGGLVVFVEALINFGHYFIH